MVAFAWLHENASQIRATLDMKFAIDTVTRLSFSMLPNDLAQLPPVSGARATLASAVTDAADG